MRVLPYRLRKKLLPLPITNALRSVTLQGKNVAFKSGEEDVKLNLLVLRELAARRLGDGFFRPLGCNLTTVQKVSQTVEENH